MSCSMHKFFIYIGNIVLIVQLWGCNGFEEPKIPMQFTPKAALPIGRASATSFVVKDNAYVTCGRDENGVYLNDLWRYDAQADTWTQLNDVPFKGRVKAVAQVINNQVYIGLGFNGHVYQDSCYLRDFWKYTPDTDTWERCADFPSKNSNVAISFAHGYYFYTACGFFSYFTSEVHKYDTNSDTWTKCDHAYFPARGGATGCSDGTHCFAGTGYNTTSMNDWWEYLPLSNKWRRLADIPGKGREFAASQMLNGRVFVLGGRYFGGSLTTGFLFDDMLEYDIARNKWLLVGHLPQGGRENMVTFTISGKGYFGLGEDANGKILNDIYSWND